MKKWIVILAVVLATLPTVAWSEATPAAKPWLDKMASIYDKAPLSAEFELTLGSGSGLPLSGSAHGKLLLKDRKHQRVEMKMSMEGAGAPGGQAMTINLLSVSDGKDAWTEMSMGTGTQVIKFALEDIEKISAAGGMGLGMSAMDPISQVEQLTKTMDIDLVSVAGGEVTLSAKMTDEAKSAMASSPVPLGAELTLVLDEKTGLPIRVTMGGDQPTMKLETTHYDFVKESELPGDAFSYTPPEGVQVLDGKQLMGMMQKPQSGGK